jgi:hypothetical protein
VPRGQHCALICRLAEYTGNDGGRHARADEAGKEPHGGGSFR